MPIELVYTGLCVSLSVCISWRDIAKLDYKWKIAKDGQRDGIEKRQKMRTREGKLAWIPTLNGKVRRKTRDDVHRARKPKEEIIS